ncbi:MAG: single-stranded DNA-binding protein [Firmicutes bacterium]|jgi:single-strand DNA-binding protein|nr:single-stranded DNA-binding protein [Bacillota bacterium]
MVNHIVLVGRLTRDPEMRYTPSGASVARFTLAVDRNRRGPDGEKQTDFIRCSIWNKQAEFVMNYVHKGRLVAVVGSLQINTVTQPDGTRRDYTEVSCYSIQALDRGRDRTDSGEIPGDIPYETYEGRQDKTIDESDDDVPFS